MAHAITEVTITQAPDERTGSRIPHPVRRVRAGNPTLPVAARRRRRRRGSHAGGLRPGAPRDGDAQGRFAGLDVALPHRHERGDRSTSRRIAPRGARQRGRPHLATQVNGRSRPKARRRVATNEDGPDRHARGLLRRGPPRVVTHAGSPDRLTSASTNRAAAETRALARRSAWVTSHISLAGASTRGRTLTNRGSSRT